MVQNFVELVADQLVDLADAVVNHRHSVLVYGHAFVENLSGELRKHVAGITLLVLVMGHTPLSDDSIKQGQGLGRALT